MNTNLDWVVDDETVFPEGFFKHFVIHAPRASLLARENVFKISRQFVIRVCKETFLELAPTIKLTTLDY